MTTGPAKDQLRVGLQVRDLEDQVLGEVAEVWPDVGVGESWGAVGSVPIEGAEAADPTKFAYTEAMPGEGDSYFRLTRSGSGGDLYVPCSAVSEVRDDAVVLAITADDIPNMQWDVQPDFVNIRSVPDSQGDPSTA